MESHLEICYLCWYFGDNKEKQCKEIFSGIYCQECYLGIKEIEDGRNKSEGKEG